jgi:glyoxylase-like metal-dependent hydrolase (beta-lactamase superfamily II)
VATDSAIAYGDLRIHPLPEGRFTVGTDKRFVPHTDDDAPRRGTLFISVTPFLVATPKEVLLLDTGLGEYAVGRDATFLLDGIRRAGFEREDVTRVLFSHLHFDHCGGAVVSAGAAADQPTFPNAEYVVQEGELDAPYGGVSEEARDRVIHTLETEGQLVTVEGDGWLTDEIEFCHTGGHTRDHQAFRLHTGGRVAVFAGDVVPSPGHLRRRFRAKYDYDAERSLAERVRIVEEATAHGHLLLLYHSPEEPAAFVDETPKGGVHVEPVP